MHFGDACARLTLIPALLFPQQKMKINIDVRRKLGYTRTSMAIHPIIHAKMKGGLFPFFTAFLVLSAVGQTVRADIQSGVFKISLSSVPAPEIPEKAATLVAQSKPADRESVALS